MLGYSKEWAEISAETAGEQYTPDDVIALIAEIITPKIEESDTLLKLYDCTCGGGNMLFGVEDRINEKFKRLTQTYGQDWNDALYALAKIESRFRPDSKIEHGNTLVDDKFYKDEFFNTGIYTYLWVLNKNKQPQHQDKVMLINASEKFMPLKKSKGSKRKEVDEANRLDIIATLTAYQDNDYAKVFEKEFFYFNKQAIRLTNIDEQGNSFEPQLKEGKKSEKLSPTKISNGERDITEFVITEFNAEHYDSLADYFTQNIKPFINSLDYKEQPLVITTKDADYYFDKELETLVKKAAGADEYLGCGKIVIKSSLKKASKTQPQRIEITVELTPDYQKDYEIIPFHKDEADNQAAIVSFMDKYISKPFEYLDTVVGVELNFNKVFYKPEKLRSVETILAEIQNLDQELNELEQGLDL